MILRFDVATVELIASSARSMWFGSSQRDARDVSEVVAVRVMPSMLRLLAARDPFGERAGSGEGVASRLCGSRREEVLAWAGSILSNRSEPLMSSPRSDAGARIFRSRFGRRPTTEHVALRVFFARPCSFVPSNLESEIAFIGEVLAQPRSWRSASRDDHDGESAVECAASSSVWRVERRGMSSREDGGFGRCAVPLIALDTPWRGIGDEAADACQTAGEPSADEESLKTVPIISDI
jgi:hypothetical protein